MGAKNEPAEWGLDRVERDKIGIEFLVAIEGGEEETRREIRVLERRGEKWGWVMRESQCLDTDLNRRREITGRRLKISVKRSSLPATVLAGVV